MFMHVLQVNKKRLHFIQYIPFKKQEKYTFDKYSHQK